MSVAKKQGPRRGRPRLKKSELGVMTSMRLGKPTLSERAQLAKRWAVDKTAVVERALNEAYGREVFGPLYVSPLDPRHPKHSANIKVSQPDIG